MLDQFRSTCGFLGEARCRRVKISLWLQSQATQYLGKQSMTIAQFDRISKDPAEILAYMEQQADLFEQAKPQIVEAYLNQYVWFENGQVLDSDPNHEALVLRIYGAGETRPLFIREVMAVKPKFLVRSAPNLS
jgi:hypothetical protein